jgi:hypothetical protein
MYFDVHSLMAIIVFGFANHFFRLYGDFLGVRRQN